MPTMLNSNGRCPTLGGRVSRTVVWLGDGPSIRAAVAIANHINPSGPWVCMPVFPVFHTPRTGCLTMNMMGKPNDHQVKLEKGEEVIRMSIRY